MSEEVIKCSFCEKDQHEVSCVIAGPKCFICNQCVIFCMDIVLIGMDENEAYATLDDMKEMVKKNIEHKKETPYIGGK